MIVALSTLRELLAYHCDRRERVYAFLDKTLEPGYGRSHYPDVAGARMLAAQVRDRTEAFVAGLTEADLAGQHSVTFSDALPSEGKRPGRRRRLRGDACIRGGRAVTESRDVVIVGGGIIGAATALYLLQQQPGLSVLLLEKQEVPGNGATAKATGGLRCQFSTRVSIEMSTYGINAVYRQFEELTGQPIGLRQNGYLFLTADAGRLSALAANVQLQQSLGVPARVISPAEARDLCPPLQVDDLAGGTYCPWDGTANPSDALQGFLRRARDLGLTVRCECPATGLIRQGDRVIGVRTPQGDVHAGAVINAAGAWAPEIGAWAGLELPVRPYRRQVFVANPLPGLPGGLPLTVDLDTGWYLHQEARGGILTGGTDRDSHPGMDESVNWDDMVRVLESGVKRMPLMSEAEIKRAYAGVRALTPDDHPILGPAPGSAGLFLSVGWGGHGFMHAPAAGRALAELVLDGASHSLDIGALALERFRTGQQHREATAF